MPELTDNQVADLRVLQPRCAALGAELVIIGAIGYLIHFPAESRHTGDIDFAVALDLDEFAELERRLLADGWVRFANREHRWRSAQATILDLIPAGPKLREAKQITWPISQFKMSLVGFDHVFATAQPVQLAPDLTLKVISSTALMLLKIVAFMDDPQRRVKDLDDIRGMLLQYEADSERIFSDVVIDAALQDFGLAPAFLMGLDLRALCADDDAQIVIDTRHGDPYGGLVTTPLVSDVQDERLVERLHKELDLPIPDAQHLAQANSNGADVFLTRDEEHFISQRQIIEAQSAIAPPPANSTISRSYFFLGSAEELSPER